MFRFFLIFLCLFALLTIFLIVCLSFGMEEKKHEKIEGKRILRHYKNIVVQMAIGKLFQLELLTIPTIFIMMA